MTILRRWQTAASLASGRESTIAFGALDPIDAAQNDIAGSKDLIASVSDDLNQHYRWLESYRSAERKHRRRIQRQQVMFQVEEHGRRAAGFVERVAVRTFNLARDAGLFVWTQATTAFFIVYGIVRKAIAWATPYARVAAMVVVIGLVWLMLEFRAVLLTWGRWFTTVSAWLQMKGSALAHETAKTAAVTSNWLYVQLRILARRSRRGLAAAWAWSELHAGKLAVRIRIFARQSRRRLNAGWAWSEVHAEKLAVRLRIFARQSRRRLNAGWAWSEVHAEKLAVRVRIFARQSRRRLATAWAWSEVHASRLACSSAEIASVTSAWLRVNGRILARESRKRLAAGMTWVVTAMPDLGRILFGKMTAISARLSAQSRPTLETAKAPPILTHQALVPKPSTALIPVKSPRVALPVVQQPARPHPARPKKARKSKRRSAKRKPVSSHAGPASP